MAAVAVRRAGATAALEVPLSVPWRRRQVPVVVIGAAAAAITRAIAVPIVHPLPGISVPPPNGQSLLGLRRRRRWWRWWRRVIVSDGVSGGGGGFVGLFEGVEGHVHDLRHWEKCEICPEVFGGNWGLCGPQSEEKDELRKP